MNFLICITILCTLPNVYSYFSKYNYRTLYFKQKVDHFSFANQDSFNERYLLSEQHWKKGGPIFFYAGNEGDITLFAENTGFMWEIAPMFNAMILFAEHRYYGKSLPYGKQSYLNTTYTGYLSSEQALADFADLLTFVRTSIDGAQKSPIIAFGGSYGGMLAAWFRIKYPHIVQGAIAASAPILQFIGLTPCEKFGQLVTKDFANESKNCSQVVRKSWSALNRMSVKPEGLTWLNKNWRLCEPLKKPHDVKLLKDYLTNVWTNLAMVDYPYPANFLAPLPARPIKFVCEQLRNPMQKDEKLLLELFDGLSIYFNFTKTAKCLDYNEEATSSLGDLGWSFQACTEMVMPFCYDGKRDFFEPTKWNLTSYANDCYQRWQVMPRPMMSITEYGGKNIQAASNIVFSNGLLDPWSTGGVLKNLSASLIAIIIPDGAHHLDLRHSDPNDPPSVVEARKTEIFYMRKWIESYKMVNV